MGDRAPSWETGDRSPSQLYHDEDVVVIDAPPKGKLPHLPLNSLAFEREIGGRPALYDAPHSVRREEEDVPNLAIIDNSDKESRSKVQKSKKDIARTEIAKDLVSEEAIKEAIKGVGYVFEETETVAKLNENISKRICEIQAEREVSLDSWRSPNCSRQEPWNRLSLYEGETPPITNLATSHKISNEDRPGHSDYFSTAAGNDMYFADTRKPEIDVSSSTTRSSVRSTLPLRQASSFPTTPTTSARPPSGALVQSAGSIKEASQIQPALGLSVDERTQRFSTKENQEGTKLVQRMRESRLSRESNVRVTFLNQTVPASDTGMY